MIYPSGELEDPGEGQEQKTQTDYEIYELKYE